MRTFKLVIFISCLVSAVISDDDPQETDNSWDYQEPDPEWISPDTNSNLGLGRFQYSDILLMTWVPHPVNEWDYVVVDGARRNEYFTKESGRQPMSKFTRDNYPDVSIIFTTASRDINYVYQSELNVPVIGVQPFDSDNQFQEYLNHIYTVHDFWNRAEMWAEFFRYPQAYAPVIDRIRSTYSTYLEEWVPQYVHNDFDDFNEIE